MVFTVLGFALHWASGGDPRPQLVDESKQLSLQIFAENRSVPVHTWLFVDHRDRHEAAAFVTVVAPADTLLLVLANQKPVADEGAEQWVKWDRPSSTLASAFDGPSDGLYYAYFRTRQDYGADSALGELVGTFDLDPRYFASTGDSVRAQLPIVADGEFGSPIASLGTVRDPDENGSTQALVEVEPKRDADLMNPDPAAWQSGKQAVKHLFFEPLDLTTSARLVLDPDAIADSELRINSPSDGVQAGNTFEWKGSNGLHPRLVAVKRSIAQSDASEEFLAGIFFASAAAALVALLQELPEEFRLSAFRPRRRRRRAAQRRVPATEEVPSLRAAPPLGARVTPGDVFARQFEEWS